MFRAPSVVYSLQSNGIPPEYQLFPNVGIYNHSGKLRSLGTTVLAVHGVGTIDGIWISSVSEAEKYFATEDWSPAGVGARIRGSLTLYLIDNSTEDIYVISDPFGSSIIWSYEDSYFKAYSSDLKSLKRSLAELGIFLSKDLKYTSLFVGTGSGGLKDSTYESVEALMPYSYVHVCATSAMVVSYSSTVDVLMSDCTYDELLSMAKHEVSLNVQAALSHQSNTKIAHLTGGVDSRLILGALLQSGQQEAVEFYCAGSKTEPDKLVAERLAVEFELLMTNYSGVSSRALPETIAQALLDPLDETEGIVSGPATGRMYHGNDLILSGGYGEFLRSFYDKGNLFDGDYPSALRRMFGAGSFGSTDADGLVSSQVIEEASDSLRNVVEFGLSVGVPDYAALDSFYLFGRNRYFVGEISRSISPYASRFDPLYSPALLALGLRTDGPARAANVPGFDLMNMFDSKLMRLPFDHDRISSVYEKRRGAVSGLSFNRLANEARYAKNPSWRITQKPNTLIERPTESHIALANALRTSPRLVAYNEYVRQGLGSMLKNYDSTRFTGSINIEFIAKLAHQTPTHRVHLRQAKNLYAALLWHFGD